MAELPPYLRPAGVLIVTAPFSIAAGELTTNLKLRRQFLSLKFRDRLAELQERAARALSAAGATTRHPLSRRRHRMSAYFLTGGTGVVGGAIAQQLLGGPRLPPHAPDTGRSRMETLAARREELLGSWELPPGATERVGAVRGDTIQPRFGLSSQEFERLATECTHVVHCAAIVKMNLSLEEARGSAVGAAKTC